MELDRNKSELTEHEREIANKLKDKINKEWECSDDGQLRFSTWRFNRSGEKLIDML